MNEDGTAIIVVPFRNDFFYSKEENYETINRKSSTSDVFGFF